MIKETKDNVEEKKERIFKKALNLLTGVPTPSYIIYIIASTPIGFALGLKIAISYIMPVINAILIYPVYLAYILKGRLKTAVVMVLVWSMMLSAVVILYSYQDPERTGSMIVMGERYKNEMFEWLKTGRGVEGDISRFLPQHLLHLSTFSILCLATGGFGGLIMGSVLLNYMNYYVGSLWQASQNVKVILYGWSIWSVIRVVGYIIISIFLSTPLINRIEKKSWKFKKYSLYLYLGLLLILLDIILKYTLSPVWRSLILKYILKGW